MKNMIDLQIQNGMIVAIFTGPHAAIVVDIFGEPFIETAFTAEYGLDRAAEEIRRLNPECVVYPA